jgi:hypothetical protein
MGNGSVRGSGVCWNAAPAHRSWRGARGFRAAAGCPKCKGVSKHAGWSDWHVAGCRRVALSGVWLGADVNRR